MPKVHYCGYSVLTAVYTCLEFLAASKKKWKYYQVVTLLHLYSITATEALVCLMLLFKTAKYCRLPLTVNKECDLTPMDPKAIRLHPITIKSAKKSARFDRRNIRNKDFVYWVLYSRKMSTILNQKVPIPSNIL